MEGVYENLEDSLENLLLNDNLQSAQVQKISAYFGILAQSLFYNHRLMIDPSLETISPEFEPLSLREKEISLMALISRDLAGDNGEFLINYLTILQDEVNDTCYPLYHAALLLSNVKLLK